MKSTKLVSVFLALTLILSMSILPSALAEDTAPQTLKILHYASDADKVVWEAIFDEFEAANPGVSVEVVWCSDSGDITNRFNAGEKADLANIPVGGLGWTIANGWISPITSYVENNGFDMSDIMQSAFLTYKGDIYGITENIETQVLYYNKDLFDKAGIAYPTDDWTWDDLKEAAKKLTVKDENGNALTWGFQYDEYCRLFVSKLWSDGGLCFDDEGDPYNCTVNSDIGVAAAAYIKALMDEGAMPAPDTSPVGYRDMFAMNCTAMTMDGSWMVQTYETSGVNYGIAMVPKGTVRRGGWHSPTGLCITSSTEKADLAFKLMQFVYTANNSVRLTGNGDLTSLYRVPVWRSAYTSEGWQQSEKSDMIAKQAAESIQELAFQDSGSWFWNTLNSALWQMNKQGLDPKAVMDEMVANSAYVATSIKHP